VEGCAHLLAQWQFVYFTSMIAGIEANHCIPQDTNLLAALVDLFQNSPSFRRSGSWFRSHPNFSGALWTAVAFSSGL
jgi:hypothetical protein